MNYKVEDFGNNCFGVIEESKDGEVIMTFLTYKEAKHAAKQYNSGLGFDGWTPSFVLKEMPISDIDDDDDDDDMD